MVKILFVCAAGFTGRKNACKVSMGYVPRRFAKGFPIFLESCACWLSYQTNQIINLYSEQTPSRRRTKVCSLFSIIAKTHAVKMVCYAIPKTYLQLEVFSVIKAFAAAMQEK